MSSVGEYLKAKEVSDDFKYFNFYPINNSDGLSYVIAFLW